MSEPRNVSEEVEINVAFVINKPTVFLELRKLFRSLITASTSSIVPERELARLTLIKPSDEDDYRRKSIASSTFGRPNLGEINGMPVQGPSLPSPLALNRNINLERPDTGQAESVRSTNNSEETLVDEAAEDADVEMSGVESDSSTDVGHEKPMNSDEDGYRGQDVDNVDNDSMEGLNVHSNSAGTSDQNESLKRFEAPNGDERHEVSKPGRARTSTDTVMLDSVRSSVAEERDPPDRPPPIPPRPEMTLSPRRPVDELELGAQQDVTEVSGNVLFQLECAMRAQGIDKDGEQLDEIKQ